MTRRDALIELRDKVKAGDASKFSVFNPHDRTWDAISPNCREASNAYHGSLDAAKSLHEAVLPEWGWHVRQDEKDGSCHAHALYPNYRVSPGGHTTESNPARAWLLAVLSALIALEEAQ